MHEGRGTIIVYISEMNLFLLLDIYIYIYIYRLLFPVVKIRLRLSALKLTLSFHSEQKVLRRNESRKRHQVKQSL